MTVATYKKIWSNKEEATKKAAQIAIAREEFFNFSRNSSSSTVGNTNSYSTARVRRSLPTTPRRQNSGRLTNFELKRSFERVLAQS